jgi:zinc D-Ala-D-Ala carboxypeptidase
MTDQLLPFNRSRGYFTLKHCVHSPIANEHQINNFPGSDHHALYGKDLGKDKIINNLHKLFKHCINPIKNNYAGLRLTSVYRNKRVNELLEGVPYSQHIYGYAADIMVPDMDSSILFNWCRLNIPSYHQLIWEYPERGTYFNGKTIFSWIHISFIEGNNFKENSVSSLDPKIHDHYKKEYTYKINDFTHGIKKANQNLITKI